ncbi:hypothetical protein DOY81_009346 [Sarcophaga bullata]|nr:hypothetical protein DOY81_009346 [Sarcophaga bullata]
MKLFIIYAAVLALVKAGQIPPEATVHQITVPVPLTVLAPPLATEQQHPEIGNVKPATVQEVNKDHKHVAGNEVKQEIPVTIQPTKEDTSSTTVKSTTTIPTSQRPMRSVEHSQTVTQQPSPGPVTIKSTDSSSSSSTAATMDPCDLLCTKFEFEPICATNSLCTHEFPNHCILETYNCKHPSQKFSVTKNDRCQMPGVAKCNENDMI